MTPTRVAATVLALVLVVAAGAKLARGDATGDDMAQLGLVAPRLLARLVPVAELVAAGLLLVWPAWGGVVSFALVAAFTAVLIPVVRSGRVVACNCFGGLSGRPVSAWTLARNAVLLVLAAVATAGS